MGVGCDLVFWFPVSKLHSSGSSTQLTEWVVCQGSNRQVGLSYKEEGYPWMLAARSLILLPSSGSFDIRRHERLLGLRSA